MGVMYRYLKIENVLIDSQGYLKIIDYGHSQILMLKDTKITSQIEQGEYSAPEMIEGKEGYSFPVDWWALGILCYELMFG